jgi:hypothetical protein
LNSHYQAAKICTFSGGFASTQLSDFYPVDEIQAAAQGMMITIEPKPNVGALLP